MSSSAIRILGLDPGLTRTGWGMISIAGSKLMHIANGAIPTKAALPLGERLLIIYKALHEVIEQHAPHVAAVEQTFVAKDPVAALKLGHARAIPLLVAAEAGLEIAEYAPNHIKKSLVGVGHADKEQVAAMVRCLLPTARFQTSDASDALACAIAHAHFSGTNARIQAALKA
ncbi:MAG: crossover junction endodeoxyribonuclease RuvC [Micropepsaceae bacterium]